MAESLKAVQIINDPKAVGLLIDPIRRAILIMLGSNEMTESQLARLLGFKASSVAHHIRALESAGLISLTRTEPENHGIMQKFYRSKALSFVIDTRKVPQNISRYFYPVNVERARAFLCLNGLELDKTETFSAALEAMAREYADKLAETAEKYSDMDAGGYDREQLNVQMYNEAFESLMNVKKAQKGRAGNRLNKERRAGKAVASD